MSAANPPSVRAVFLPVFWLILCLASFSAALIDSESSPQIHKWGICLSKGFLIIWLKSMQEKLNLKNPPTCLISYPPENASPEVSSCLLVPVPPGFAFLLFPRKPNQYESVRSYLCCLQKQVTELPTDLCAGSTGNKAYLCVVWCLCSASHPPKFPYKVWQSFTRHN